MEIQAAAMDDDDGGGNGYGNYFLFLFLFLQTIIFDFDLYLDFMVQTCIRWSNISNVLFSLKKKFVNANNVWNHSNAMLCYFAK